MKFDELPESLRADLAPEPLDIPWRELVGPRVPLDFLRHQPRNGHALLSRPEPLLEAPNVFEAIVERVREERFITPLLQVFNMVFYLRDIPAEGDTLMLHLPPTGETSEVLVWSHEEHFFSGPIAWDIPTALRVLEVYESRSATPEERSERLKPALGRFATTEWPFRFLLAQLEGVEIGDGAVAIDPPKSSLQASQNRSSWLARALSNQLVEATDFSQQLDWTADKALAGTQLVDYPPTGLYWLWRSFFLDEAWLDDVLDVVRESPSRLVRDAAALVDDLRCGRRTKVADVPLLEICDEIQAMAKPVDDPYPTRFEIGPLAFVRDDAATPKAKPMPKAPEPRGDGITWDTGSVVACHSDRCFVEGSRPNPKAGPSYQPDTIGVLAEVGPEGELGMVMDLSQIVAMHVVTPDLFLVATPHVVCVVGRNGDTGAYGPVLNGSARATLFVHDAVVRLGVDGTVGVYSLSPDGEWVDHSTLPVDLTEGASDVVANPDRGVAYRIERLER